MQIEKNDSPPCRIGQIYLRLRCSSRPESREVRADQSERSSARHGLDGSDTLLLHKRAVGACRLHTGAVESHSVSSESTRDRSREAEERERRERSVRSDRTLIKFVSIDCCRSRTVNQSSSHTEGSERGDRRLGQRSGRVRCCLHGPKASATAAAANSGSPAIGAYSLFILASWMRLAASDTDLMLHTENRIKRQQRAKSAAELRQRGATAEICTVCARSPYTTGLLLSSRYAPTPKFIFLGLLSSLNACATRMMDERREKKIAASVKSGSAESRTTAWPSRRPQRTPRRASHFRWHCMRSPACLRPNERGERGAADNQLCSAAVLHAIVPR